MQAPGPAGLPGQPAGAAPAPGPAMPHVPGVSPQNQRHVQTLVANMAQLQANNNRPLTQQQQEIMMRHLLVLYSGTANPTQQQVTDHAAALLRAFAANTPLPPVPKPINAQPAAARPAPPRPAGPAQPPVNQQILLQAALLLQQKAGAGGNPAALSQIAALLQQAGQRNLLASTAMARPQQHAPPPARQRMGFTPEQLAVLRAQIIVFKKIKKNEPISPEELSPAVIKPPPLTHSSSQLHSSLRSTAAAKLKQPQAQARKDLPKAGPTGPPPFQIPPKQPTKASKDYEALMALWPGPPPEEYRGDAVVARGTLVAGPLMGLNEPQLELTPQQLPTFKDAHLPGRAGPQFDLAPVLQQELSRILARKRKRRMDELSAMLELEERPNKQLTPAPMPAPRPLLPPAPLLQASLPMLPDGPAPAAGPPAGEAPPALDAAQAPAPTADGQAQPGPLQPGPLQQQQPPVEVIKIEDEGQPIPMDVKMEDGLGMIPLPVLPMATDGQQPLDQPPLPLLPDQPQVAGDGQLTLPDGQSLPAGGAAPGAPQDPGTVVLDPQQQLLQQELEQQLQEQQRQREAEEKQRLAKLEEQRRRRAELQLVRADVPPVMVSGFVVGENGEPARGAVQLELRKLKLLTLQARLRREIEQEHSQSLLYQDDKGYKAVAQVLWQWRKQDLRNRDQARLRALDKQAEEGRLFKAQQQERLILCNDLRKTRNRGVLKLHERINRDLIKRQGDDHTRRMEALKANDLDAYQELIRQQQQVGDTEDDKFKAITTFLRETEDYLNKLATRLANIKAAEESSEYVQKVMEEARRGGATQEEVYQAGLRAAQEAEKASEYTKKSKNKNVDAQTRYYELAHSKQEDITEQPVYLKPPNGAKLREYQMVGLRWMVSLYNNKLNGILADEMGLGKTVQVMALIAYLMEKKHVYGPHLIIVPNAVIVNWKSELNAWLPGVKCVYYVGSKDERARKFQQEVLTMNFNILVTTYEYIMRDRSKLCKVEWKYIIIDEAQRLKERQSKLSRDLDKFTTGRRLLLTGTPLQNELRELWNLLNLLLPEVFDDKKQFGEWFDTMLEEEDDEDDMGAKGNQSEKQQLAHEKKLVVVHRLHQILMPFMLRRQVQDVEGKLPPKVPVIIKVPMTPYQSNIYNWVRLTSTLKLHPQDPYRERSNRTFVALQNRVMELRKVCNHPLLSYSALSSTGPEMLAQCGKLLVLDRLLVKFTRTGHRVLLFCTMTKLLDLLEQYLKWRTLPDGRLMQYRRIDGATPLEMREAAIQDFNRPDSEVFIFLLSIRAAGRGLNLQTSDTVIIYDPDPNPKNEEQAIARSHRIGQKKEVRVIHLETVTDPVDYGEGTESCIKQLAYKKHESQMRGEKMRYGDSVESLIRNVIQKTKIDMANEVIDAGRFDMNTTMDERKATLEAILTDEGRNKLPQNEVLEWSELNRLMARGDEELEIFNQLDEELEWPGDDDNLDQTPDWLQFDPKGIREATQYTRKKQPNTGILAIQDGTLKNLKGKGRGKPTFGNPGWGKPTKGRGRGRGRGARGGKAGGGGGGGGGGRFGRPAAAAGGPSVPGRPVQVPGRSVVSLDEETETEEEEEGPSQSVYSGGTTNVPGNEEDEDDDEVALMEQEEADMEEEEKLDDNILDDEEDPEGGDAEMGGGAGAGGSGAQ